MITIQNMKKLTILLSLSAVLMLVLSCKHKPQSETVVADTVDTVIEEDPELQFDSVHFEQEPKGVPSFTCYIHVDLPVDNGDIPTAAKMRATLVKDVFQHEGDAEKAMRLFIEESKAMVPGEEEYLADKEEYGVDDYMYQWERRVNIRKDISTADYLKFDDRRYGYTGGVHGLSYAGYYNFDVRTGKLLDENDVFLSDSRSRKAINKLIKDAVRVYEKENGIEVYEWEAVTMNGNFAANPKGIEYTFNQYEIACYADGITTITIPFEKIAPYMVDGTGIKIYLEKCASEKGQVVSR